MRDHSPSGWNFLQTRVLVVPGAVSRRRRVMTGRTFRNWAFALWLGGVVGWCPGFASSAPLAMVDPSRPATTFFDPVLRDQSLSDAQDENALPAELRRQIVAYPTQEAPGTIVIDTPHTYLYYVLGGGRAIRYAIGVGREGFTWAGAPS